MPRYRFVVAASLAALEQELNRLVGEEPDLEFIQLLHAPGTGFIAVVKGIAGIAAGPAPAAGPAEPRKRSRRSQKPD